MVGWGHSTSFRLAFAISGVILRAVLVIIEEAANLAAYAFAPAILVIPLGALSVLTGAVLGSYFMKEELGILGKLGCAVCLIGSVIIVVHAPPEKEIKTIDEILYYLIQPGTRPLVLENYLIDLFSRFLDFLHGSFNFFRGHDISSFPKIWKEESSDLYLHFLDRGISLSHVNQGPWNRSQTNSRWKQSVHTPFDV
jgi:hypothetical protein